MCSQFSDQIKTVVCACSAEFVSCKLRDGYFQKPVQRNRRISRTHRLPSLENKSIGIGGTNQKKSGVVCKLSRLKR